MSPCLGSHVCKRAVIFVRILCAFFFWSGQFIGTFYLVHLVGLYWIALGPHSYFTTTIGVQVKTLIYYPQLLSKTKSGGYLFLWVVSRFACSEWKRNCPSTYTVDIHSLGIGECWPQSPHFQRYEAFHMSVPCLNHAVIGLLWDWESICCTQHTCHIFSRPGVVAADMGSVRVSG